MNLRATLLYFALLLTLVFFSCRKSTTTPATPPPYAYTVMPHKIFAPATWMKDSLMHFRTYVLPDSSFFWEFGDGATSTDSMPSHVYTDTGIYTVKLTINGHATTACSSTVAIITPPIYTASMGGIRIWHDTFYTYKDKTYIDPRADDTFAIIIVNPVQVQFKDRTLIYAPSLSTDSTLCFSDYDVDAFHHSHNMTASYYRYSDSIVVSQHNQVSAGGATGEKWVTP